MKKKAQMGDIVEIKTPAGLAYIQYTHDSRSMGQLVRVLPGLFSARPQDFSELAKQKELYFVFYTLNYALRDKQAEIVSHQPIPQWAKPYPLMRWPGIGEDQTGKPTAWKIFDASTELTLEAHRRIPFLRELTAEQEKLSIDQLWPPPVMVRELARGWTPERAEELRLQDVAAAEERERKKALEGKSVENKSSEKPMRHYLYFPKKANAEKAAERLRNRGFSVEVRMGADGENWLALAKKASPETGEDMEELRDEMETLAKELNGEYDGWDLAVDSTAAPNGEGSQRVH